MFTAGQGPAGDGDYSAVSWLIHRTGITRGAAIGHSAWARRAETHPRVIAALGAGQVPESAGRLICLWTDKLPLEYRDAADEQLLWPRATVTPDGVRVTSHSPVPDNPGSVA